MNEKLHFGIDVRSGIPFYSSLTIESGRTIINKLHCGQDDSLIESTNDNNHVISITVPDKDALIKKITLTEDNSLDMEACCKFEMVATLLEPEENFNFRSFKGPGNKNHFGLIFRKSRLQELCDSVNIEYSEKITFRTHAEALGIGFIGFAESLPGDLVVVADICRDAISICFLYQNQIAKLTSLDLSSLDLRSDREIKQIAIELRTLINFSLAELVRYQITIPISTLVLTGDNIDKKILDIFSEHFPVGVTVPVLNNGYFNSDIENSSLPSKNTASETEISQDQFLSALGAAVK